MPMSPNPDPEDEFAAPSPSDLPTTDTEPSPVKFDGIVTETHRGDLLLMVPRHDPIETQYFSPTHTGLSSQQLSLFPEVEYRCRQSQECLCGEGIEEGQKVKFLPCCHVFHVGCIDPWLRSQGICPVDKRGVLDFGEE